MVLISLVTSCLGFQPEELGTAHSMTINISISYSWYDADRMRNFTQSMNFISHDSNILPGAYLSQGRTKTHNSGICLWCTDLFASSGFVITFQVRTRKWRISDEGVLLQTHSMYQEITSKGELSAYRLLLIWAIILIWNIYTHRNVKHAESNYSWSPEHLFPM